MYTFCVCTYLIISITRKYVWISRFSSEYLIKPPSDQLENKKEIITSSSDEDLILPSVRTIILKAETKSQQRDGV